MSCTRCGRTLEKGKSVMAPHVCPITGMEFVVVQGGEFQMGDIWGDLNEKSKPIHQVRIATFFLCKYQVTQGQWMEVMGGKNPMASFRRRWVGPNQPVAAVNWHEIQEFITRLNDKSDNKYNYRLPSEAEWEYAARSGGKQDKWAGTNQEDSLSDYSWYFNLINSKNIKINPQKIGQKRPNDLDIYDMSGNVWEWCEDVWHNNYEDSPLNGRAWISGDNLDRRVVRGGAYNNYQASCLRTAFREWDYAHYRSYDRGFRLAFLS